MTGQRHDRTGELVDTDEVPVVHRCRGGWLGSEDRPAPCPVCRPHLGDRPASTPPTPDELEVARRGAELVRATLAARSRRP